MELAVPPTQWRTLPPFNPKEVKTIAMGRIVLLYLFQFARRVLQSITPQPREESYSTYSEETEGRMSVTAILMIVGLSFYILGGLGYYAKVHCWDQLTDVQKGVVVQAMIANEQAL
jgi:hypothetical protein